MARIAGVNIPNHQHAEIALTAIYGIGRPRAKAICAAAGVPGSAKIKDLTDSQMDGLREHIATFTVEVDLLTRPVVARVAQAGNSIGGAITHDGTLVAAQNYAPG